MATTTIEPRALTALEKKNQRNPVKQKWSEVHGEHIEAKKNWQRAAFASFGLTGLSIMGMIHFGSLPKSVVVPIEVDKQGHIVSATDLRDLPLTNTIWTEIYKTRIVSFVEYWRTVSSDKTAQATMKDRVYAMLGSGSAAHSDINQWYATNDPLTRLAAGNLVRVQIDTTDREGDRTYGVWWTEITTSLTGEVKSKRRWHCVFTFVKKQDIQFLITEIRPEEVRG